MLASTLHSPMPEDWTPLERRPARPEGRDSPRPGQARPVGNYTSLMNGLSSSQEEKVLWIWTEMNLRFNLVQDNIECHLLNIAT